MTEIAIEEGAKVAWALLKPVAGFLAAAAVGFAAAETYEHKVPWGLKHKLTAAVNQQTNRYNNGVRDGIVSQVAADKTVFDAWARRVAKADSDLLDARNATADALTRAQANTSKQASAAYNLGRATCGAATHATPSTSQPGADRPPGSVLYDGQSGDFADLIAAGAYTAPR